ncbi:hypothetical protein [Cellulophaga sp. Hel_I_12]|uniref:hypothetical protein n=1 Tax=Cellulophaga sp. Hel_I_12 TaxID=1249972 RepID=UPI000690E819|nr:hypothetical protein [Cellulophaga sp. Hel_I_12]
MEKKKNKDVIEAKKYNPNVTANDKTALGKKGLSMDTGDDRLLEKRKEKIDFAGEDLDVPGRNEKNQNSHQNLKDEENSLYGQGGANNDNLETTER